MWRTTRNPIHSVRFPDGTEWDAINGIRNRPIGFDELRDLEHVVLLQSADASHPGEPVVTFWKDARGAHVHAEMMARNNGRLARVAALYRRVMPLLVRPYTDPYEPPDTDAIPDPGADTIEPVVEQNVDPELFADTPDEVSAEKNIVRQHFNWAQRVQVAVEATAKNYGVTSRDVYGRSRRRGVGHARNLAVWAATQFAPNDPDALFYIGKVFRRSQAWARDRFNNVNEDLEGRGDKSLLLPHVNAVLGELRAAGYLKPATIELEAVEEG
jgi:hypothetical protein